MASAAFFCHGNSNNNSNNNDNNNNNRQQHDNNVNVNNEKPFLVPAKVFVVAFSLSHFYCICQRKNQLSASM